MPKKILVPLYGNDVAPRFDLATEVVITSLGNNSKSREEKIVVLSQASAEQLCHLILTEGVDVVICSGIEEEYYQYLTWKKVQVVDSVIGPWQAVLERFSKHSLKPGDIIYRKTFAKK
ncbi:MAG: dinitrogenase iron-molybdenum cofactor biosynthesis protein [Desulfobacterales bacterium]|uniref:Dinitrogenase iron-molybdenum cofactor biosynthesis protein n=1 Tax=Candidatus Desulfatibia vada TaxID=2841696 RepID=A0A8J6TPT5_9BACT|nr:dinitrogenase iron-molybdenum cofactor biosynthesis protein [Candidatus Desulfatibia vada]MBL6972722.1 dinitrogenase iron-molybdenum cofactor biosynthesis protein [Desulfobacterales bacterium]